MRKRIWCRALMIAVVLLAAALVWHDLGTREVLGRDENATITKLDQPNFQTVLGVTQIKVTGQPGNMQPLYFLLEHAAWPMVGRSAFMLRFLSSVFGVLVVVVAFKLGEALWGCQAGLTGALLTSLLPLHVRYSQIARPYTLLALFSLASAYFLVRGLKTNQVRHWLGFVLTAALGFYTHYNALMVLAVEGLFTGIVWLCMLPRALKSTRAAHRLTSPILSFIALGLLCVPGLLRLAGLSGEEIGGEGSVPLSITFFRQFMYMSGLIGPWRQVLVIALMAVGTIASLYRRRWQPVLFTALWIVVPFVILSVMDLPRPFVERYVIFVPPVALLLASRGVTALVEMLARLSRRWEGRGLERSPIRGILTAVLAIGFALILVAPLRAEYASNRQVGRLDDTLAAVERHARPEDVIVVSPRFFVRPLVTSGAEVIYLSDHPSDPELDTMMDRAGRMFVLYTSYLPAAALQEPVDRWVQAQGRDFIRVPIKAITALALGSRGLATDEQAILDLIPVLENLAAVSAGNYEAWQRYDLLAGAYDTLAGLAQEQGESARAEEYRQKAEEARATAPPPW